MTYNNDSSGLKADAKHIKPDIASLKYFGDCKNTVDADHMWDATQMAQVIENSSIISLKDLKDIGIKFEDGSRKIPNVLKRWFKANQHKLNDELEVVCGLNKHQHIFFIYVTQLDTHFFFDAE